MNNPQCSLCWACVFKMWKTFISSAESRFLLAVYQMFLSVWGSHLAVEPCAETPFYLSSLWKSPQMSGYVSSSKVKRQVLCVWRCGMRMGSGCLPTLLIKVFRLYALISTCTYQTTLKVLFPTSVLQRLTSWWIHCVGRFA